VAVSRRPLTLEELARRLAAVGLLEASAVADVAITGVSDDSRRVAPGDLFCAWRGTAFDAHDALVDVARAGAAAAIVERLVDGASIPQLLVRDGRRAAAVGAAAVYGDPQSRLRLAAVTGTNGKTTTVWILRHLLGLHAPTASLGTLGVVLEDGTTLHGSDSLTTPGPVELARTLRLLVDRGIGNVVLEASSHALHQGRMDALRFDAAVFTNLTRDHLDYHGTLEAYLAAKLSLCALLAADGAAVVNADDPAWAAVTERAVRVLRFGVESPADVRAWRVQLGRDGSGFDCAYDGRTVPFRLPLIGAFNVQNALGAIAAGLAMGLDLDALAARLATVPQVPGRLERIASRPCPVLRDYAHSPDALRNALGALRPLVRGRLLVVFGAGGDRDRGKRPLMGAEAERGADVAIITSDNPRTEDPDAILDDIESGMTGGRHIRIVDRREAIAHALAIARPDDLILLAGKGHETYQVVGRETRPFDERVIVEELQGARGSAG
jgi:UDP-N-acetylmuramoyl-L-alanyl-D-glutamate--2,6-diaminopimelate ligase